MVSKVEQAWRDEIMSMSTDALRAPLDIAPGRRLGVSRFLMVSVHHADRVPLSFNSRDEAQEALDDWVRGHQPPQTAVDLAEFEREHLLWFGQEYGRLIAYFDVAFDQLVAVVEQVNFIDRSSWPPNRALQYMLLSHNLTPFVSMVDRFSRGYYEDSVAHSRTLYETFLRVVFISCYGDDPWGAFPISTPKGTSPFNATNFPRDELRLAWQQIYRSMSAVAHSNFPAIAESLRRIQEGTGDPEIFGLNPAEDERMLTFAMTFHPFLMASYTRFILECCIGDITVPNPEQLTSARQSVDWMTFLLTDNDNSFWRDVSVDMDYVFDVVSTADAGGDWRTLRARRPVVPPA